MKSGSLQRKISAAVKAYTDFSFLADWIVLQVHLCPNLMTEGNGPSVCAGGQGLGGIQPAG